MTEPLKPCPFCGGKAKLRAGGNCFVIECKCLMTGPVFDKQFLIKAWNTRHGDSK